MSGSKTPTIEQRSTFSAKTKEGADVDFVATIKYYVNPVGDVKITAPGSQPPPAASHTSDTSKEDKPKEETVGKETPKEEPKKKSDDEQGSKTKHKDEDVKPKKGMYNDGICQFREFVPDPCKAFNDLACAVKDFMSCSSKKCQSRPKGPDDVANRTPKGPLTPKEQDSKGLDANDLPDSDVMDKETKYDV